MSETTVTGLRTCPKGWESNTHYAYIGRAGRGQDGYFGNPHPVGEQCDLCHDVHERGEAVEAYRITFENSLADPKFRQRIQSLRGKILVCFCHPRACHGDVIAAWLNRTEPVMGFQGQYRWLSNFAGAEAANTKWPMRINYEGGVYPSVEHAYQAAKTLNSDERLQIAETARASSTKHLGRRVTLRSDWNDIRLTVMLDLLFQKFSPTLNPDLAGLLLATRERELIEFNTWRDDFWGMIDWDANEPAHERLPRRSNQGHIVVGHNHLGRLLMKVRTHLKDVLDAIEHDAMEVRP